MELNQQLIKDQTALTTVLCIKCVKKLDSSLLASVEFANVKKKI